MSIALVRQALETRLLAITPPVHAVPENSSYTPVSGTPYQEMYLMPAQPDNPTLGGTYRREVGVFQVSLMYPQGAGPGEAQTRALAVQAHFPRGIVLAAGGATVLILRTPHIHHGRVDRDRWRVDIDIRWQSEAFS